MPEKKEQIYILIPLIMGDIGHVGKDKVNSFQHYNFRGIDDVYNCVGPVLVKHGVFIVPSVKSVTVNQVTTSGGKASTQIVMEVAYRFYAPDGSFVEAITVGEAMDTSDKAANKAMSDAMKYAVWQTLCIPTIGIDSEQDSIQQEAPKPAPEPKPKPNPLNEKLEALATTFGVELCTKGKLALIKADGSHYDVKDAITRMGDVNELERMLNAGEIS